MRDAIMVALKREAAGGKTKKLYLVADALVDKALSGDVAAIKEVCDRVDGKAPQSLDVDANGNITVQIVQFSADNPPAE